jgi:predicted nuclease of restriction endonuclease-like (RecB) superfamily
LLASADKIGMLQGQRQPEQPLRPVDVLKDPYVLEFLDLPSTPQLHESQLEDAIITRLQQFLLELGRGWMATSAFMKSSTGSKATTLPSV